MKQKWRDVRPYLLAGLVYRLSRFISSTLRIKAEGWEAVRDQPGGKILVCWHGRTFIGVWFCRDRGTWSIISQSKDGDMQDTIFRRYGYRTIRGSSKRGGVGAAIEAIRALKEGGEMVVTPDGPRGPSGVVQDGIVLMARKAGVPVYPVALTVKWRVLVKSWDRYLVPVPFSKALLIFGSAYRITEDADAEEQEVFRKKIQADLHRLEIEAEARMGHPAPTWHKSEN